MPNMKPIEILAAAAKRCREVASNLIQINRGARSDYDEEFAKRLDEDIRLRGPLADFTRGRVNVRLDGEKRPGGYHPMSLKYHTKAGVNVPDLDAYNARIRKFWGIPESKQEAANV